MENKVAIVLHAGTESHEGLARALHSLLYTKELSEHGVDVQLIFDGAGTEWIARFGAPDTPQAERLAALFGVLKEQGVTYEVCDFCSGAFGVQEELRSHGEPLTGKYMDHPSIASLVTDGYQVWVL